MGAVPNTISRQTSVTKAPVNREAAASEPVVKKKSTKKGSKAR